MTSTAATIALSRPPMPSPADEHRATHQRTRLELLTEEHHDVASDWRVEHIGDERAAVQGPLDLSINPIANICRQLSTPGHYGSRPTIMHADAAGLDLHERMDESGYWTRMQEVEYLALGLGDVFVAHGWDDRTKRLSYRIVAPHNVVIFTLASAPDVPVGLWELGIRIDPLSNAPFWAWDQYDISDPDAPTYKIVRAKVNDGENPDVTAQHLPADFGPYPWKRKDGRPVLRHLRYRDADTGRAWNTYQKRGAHHGTLNAILLASYMMHCARDASGRTVIMVGVEPMVGNQQNIGTRDQITTVPLMPGTICYHQPSPDSNGQHTVTEVGPGANLMDVAVVSGEYEIRQAIRWGLNPADITRQHANPTSGAALAISNKAKREFADRTTPVFRRVDRQALELSAIVSRVFGGIDCPEDGYSISYSQIPLTPDELAAEREDDDWQIGHSLKSPIDLYIERHPGATRESALTAIARAKADEGLIADAVLALAPQASSNPGGGDAAKAQDTALNGAQVEALLLLVGQVARGEVPRETAVEIIVVSFNRTPDEADRLLGKVGTPAFVPPPPIDPAKPAPPPPA